ncbi:SRPBCC domain-containing protein [Catenuloplanes sp. NPDC051500]|uniref:SRPBCC domain-containing protein n=1 Tax=Catenuloplanes sp. NPDC051500 TaxID=3363959 RepID=UPI00379B94A5
MSTITVTRMIQAPAARVWRLFTDLHQRATWLSTVDQVEVLTAGELRPGSVWRETRRLPDGGRVTEEFRVEECDEGLRFVVSSSGVGADYRMTYTFAPVRTGRRRGDTVVTAVQEGTPLAPRARLVALLLGGLAAVVSEGALRQDLHDLEIAVRGQLPAAR